MPDEVKPWITMSHPDIADQAVSHRDAFDSEWAEKGWVIVEEHDEAPSMVSPEPEPEMLVDSAGNITDTPADPQRLTKVLAGEVKPEDVGVDPAVLDAPSDAQPDPEPAVVDTATASDAQPAADVGTPDPADPPAGDTSTQGV